MVVFMKNTASDEEIETVITNLNAYGFDVHRSSGVSQTVLGAIGVQPGFDHRIIRGLNGVADVQRVTEPYKFASRVGRDTPSIIDVEGVKIGGQKITVMAGFQGIEGRKRMESVASNISSSGASFLRGNTLKQRTSFYEFQGLEKDELKLMREISDQFDLKLVMEVDAAELVGMISNYASILVVGARNMQNFELLRELGGVNRTVLLERGFAATVEEWIMAAEYIMRSGNTHVILCERGIRTFESATRFTLDLSAVSVAKTKSHLPVFVDPSQATGIRNHVTPLARAAIAAGADGVIVDVHDDSPNASESGVQTLDFYQFSDLITQIKKVAIAVGRI